MSALGTKRTYRVALHMSAFGSKADLVSSPNACRTYVQLLNSSFIAADRTS
jgi:hypothetical protein